ncbi:MAG TPA: Calx-beta domain-containing protein [Woeseiaceae bacterium]|nr:Calx-beta domain-containing protein [Woeseiaceae bacterium]
MMQRRSAGFAAAILLLALSAVPAAAQQADSPLFEGTTADLWLVDPETGRISGYNVGFWSTIDVLNASSALNVSGSEALLINLLPSSSVPMTPGQPAVSLIGVGESAVNLADGKEGRRELLLTPDGGSFSATTAVDVGVSRELLRQGVHELSWQAVDTDTLATVVSGGATLGPQTGDAGDSGFATETFHLVEAGTFNVTVELRSSGALVASRQASFTLAIDPSQRRRDTDGDGIPDLVEIDMGLDPLEDDWTLDADGDGWSEFDEWLRRYCLDPATGTPVDGDTACLDAEGLPLDSDADNWSDFDEILRDTNHLDPEPQLDGVLGEPPSDGGGDTGGTAEILPPSIQSAAFCTDGSTFYFDLYFYAAAGDEVGQDVILGVGADSFPFQSGAEAIRVNFGQEGEITRQSPIVRSSADGSGVLPPDRWLDGPIADFTIDKIAGFDWHVYGSVPVGTEPFSPGDRVASFALRTFFTDPDYRAFGGNYVISDDPADCVSEPLPPPPPQTDGDLSEAAERQRLRFKDFPSAQRLYEVERVVAVGAGSLVARPPAALTVGLESAGAGTESYSGTVVQTFTAAETNLAGIDVLVAAGEQEPLFDDLTLNVWQDSRRNGELLASQTLRDVRIDPSAATPVSFRFEAVPLQTGQTVYLEFRKETAALVSTGADTLAGGAVTAIDGVETAGDTDLVISVLHDTAFANGAGGERPGSRWWNVGAADLNGRVSYDGSTLLRDSEIVAAGLAAGDIAARRRMSTLEAALLADELPVMRLPAGESLVLAAVHRHRSVSAANWKPPADYSRVHKLWLPRVSDVTPVDMLTDQGEGTWQTPDEWRAAFVSYLESRLVIPAAPSLDESSTLAVAVMESALSEEAHLSGDDALQLLTPVFQPGQPVYLWEPLESVFASPAANPSPYAENWELGLGRLATGDFTLDQSLDAVTTALTPGNPLAAVGDWLRARFYEGVPGTVSDEYMARQLRRSFDGSCFVRADLVADLQANQEGWSEFLDRCPAWFDETGIAQRLEDDRERRYQVRLNLLPEAPAEVAADATLLTRETDSDADGYFNVSEVSVPVDEVTLPWLADSDGDSIADGDDRCPNDPLDECGPNPVLPTITVEADLVVFEPSAATGTALVAVQMNRLYDEPVTVCYEALVDTTDTATAGEDFDAITGCVVIEPGQLSALIEVPIYADGAAEGAESFTVNITSVENGTVADDGTVLVTLNDSEATALPPDVQLASNAIITDERQNVSLDASASTDPNGESLSYSWAQIATAAPAVTLQGLDSAVASFTAPVTLDPVDLEFEVVVTNDSGLSAVDQVTVTVNPVNDPPFVTAEPSEQVVTGDTLEFADETLLAFVEDPDNDPLTTGAILTQPSIGRVEDTGTSFLYSSSVEPTLVADQVNEVGISGGIGTPVVQTFVPQQFNLAGVDAYLNGTSSLTADVTLNVWPAGAVGIGEPLVTATIPDHPRLTEIPFRFDPIQVIPGQSYALEFRFSTLLIGTNLDTYPDGEIVGRPGSDVFFRTYYDPTVPLQVPLPDQVSPGPVTGGLGDPVVQTFVPRQSNLIGIDAFLSGTAAFSSDVTVKVWREEALRVGEPLVTSTLADVPRSSTMQFRFPAVELVPGESYAMEFLISDALVMGVLVPGQYPDGAVIEGGGNLFDGGVDVVFTTYYDTAYTPTDLFATRVSEPQIVTWQLLGDDQQLLLHESGPAGDFPGTDRVVAFDLATRVRELLLEAAPSEFRTGARASAGWFTLPGELHRYDALATETFASAAAPGSLPASLAATAVDPRNGDLVYCGGADPVLGLPGWVRVDSDTLAASEPVGNCPGSADLIGAPVAERFCVVFGQSNLVCTGTGSSAWAAEVEAAAFGAGDHRLVGLVPAGDSALLFVIREESSIPQAIGVYLIDESGFDPTATDPLTALEPLVLLERELPVGVMPQVEVMPDGRVVIILAPSAAAGLDGQPLEMWTWSGDPADLTMTQIDTGGLPTLEDRMGALATVDGVLYWQVQAFDSTPARLIYVVDPLPGATSPLGLYATVSGDAEGAPYDFLVAGPETFGVFVETGTVGVCDVLELPTFEPGAENASCQRYASVPGAGALYELDNPDDGDSIPDDLIFLGAGEATTGPTSFSIEVTDGEFTIELPVNIEVIEP